jgi:hypothetical protein
MARPKKESVIADAVVKPDLVEAALVPGVEDPSDQWSAYCAIGKTVAYGADRSVLRGSRADAEAAAKQMFHGVVCKFSELADKMALDFPRA